MEMPVPMAYEPAKQSFEVRIVHLLIAQQTQLLSELSNLLLAVREFVLLTLPVSLLSDPVPLLEAAAIANHKVKCTG